jgi:hypothetical protein
MERGSLASLEKDWRTAVIRGSQSMRGLGSEVLLLKVTPREVAWGTTLRPPDSVGSGPRAARSPISKM